MPGGTSTNAIIRGLAPHVGPAAVREGSLRATRPPDGHSGGSSPSNLLAADSPGLIEHMNVPRGRAQVGLAEPVHHRLRVLPGVDQPRGVRVPDLVGGRLERDPAFRDRAGPDPVPALLVQVGLVGVTRLLPPAPGLTRGGGGPPDPHPLAAILPGPLPAARAPALRLNVTAQRPVSVNTPAQRLAVAQRPDLLLRQSRLSAAWRDDQIGREDHLRLADAVLGHVPAHELDHRPIELEPACLAVLGVVAHQERLALRMMLTGHL